MAQKDLCDLAREKMLQDRGALFLEEGDHFREHKAMLQDNFLSSWLREDGEGKKERKMEVDGNQRRGERKEEKRRGERRERHGVCLKKVRQSCFD